MERISQSSPTRWIESFANFLQVSGVFHVVFFGEEIYEMKYGMRFFGYCADMRLALTVCFLAVCFLDAFFYGFPDVRNPLESCFSLDEIA